MLRTAGESGIVSSVNLYFAAPRSPVDFGSMMRDLRDAHGAVFAAPDLAGFALVACGSLAGLSVSKLGWRAVHSCRDGGTEDGR